MLPIQDINPTRRFPIMTYLLIGINVVVFFWEISLPPEALQRQFELIAVVPRAIAAAPFSLESILDIIRAMFLHGGWDHIIGNMLYLYLFGDNIEDRFGILIYVPLYFVCGFAATFAQVLIDPTSTIPNIGASGAIAGILGAYLVLFPNVTVRAIVPLGYFSTLADVPAIFVLGMWFVLQLVNGFASLGLDLQYGGGIAFFAHIGGFVVGVVLTLILMMIFPQPPAADRRQMLYDRAQRYRF